MIAVAPVLRRAWFCEVVPELERRIPGAWEGLSQASIGLTDDDKLTVRVAAVYPILAPVHGQVRATVLSVLRAKLPNDIPCAVKFSRRRPTPVHRNATGRDVYHWGDPHPDDWPDIIAPLLDALADTDDPVRAVLTRARVEAVSQRGVWLCFPDAEARRAVGTTSGAAYALKMALDGWQRGAHAAIYSRSDRHDQTVEAATL